MVKLLKIAALAPREVLRIVKVAVIASFVVRAPSPPRTEARASALVPSALGRLQLISASVRQVISFL